MRRKKQLGLWFDQATCDLINELATGKHTNVFMEELVQQEAARRKGELVESRILPLLREMIQQEFLRTITQFVTSLREEIHRENQESKADIIAEMKARERRS